MIEVSQKSTQDATTSQMYAQLVGNLWTLCDLWSQGIAYSGLDGLTKLKFAPKSDVNVRRLNRIGGSDVQNIPVENVYRRLLSEVVRVCSEDTEEGTAENGNTSRLRLNGTSRPYYPADDDDEEEFETVGGIQARWKDGVDDLGQIPSEDWKEDTKNKHIGTGTYSTVVKATLRGSKVAAKIFNRRNTSEFDFLREVRVLSRMRHPGVVGYRGYYNGDDRYVMFTDLMRTSIYDEYLADGKQIDEVPFNVRLRWCLQLARTIEWMHSVGYVHRDINPKNILLSDVFEARLCDFTFALPFVTRASPLKDHDAIRRAQKEILGDGVPLHVGTTRYMAPEIAAKETDEIDFEASEIWSLGHTLLDILTGHKPYESIEGTPEVIMDFLALKVEKAGEQDPRRPETYRDERTTVPIAGLQSAPPDSLKRFLNELCKCFLIDPQLRPSATEVVACLTLYNQHIHTSAFIERNQGVMFPALSKFDFETFPTPDKPSMTSFVHAASSRRAK